MFLAYFQGMLIQGAGDEDKRGINEEMRINAGIYTTRLASVARICGGGIKEGRCRMPFLIWEIPK